MTFSKRALVLAVASAFALSGCAGGAVGFGMETAEDGKEITDQINAVQFDVPVGDVRISVQPGGKTHVGRKVNFRGQLPKDTFRVQNGTLILDGCADACSVDYKLTLPHEVAIKGNAGTGTVEITGAASVDITSDVGSVTAKGISGPAKVDAKVGSVNLAFGAAADATVVAGAGSVNLTVPAGPYQVQAKAKAGKTKVDVPSEPTAKHKLDLVSHSSNVTVSAA